MHPVDSNDISFKIAGMMAFKEAFQLADPKILEPIYEIEILVPEEWWVMWWRIFSRDVPSFLAWIQRKLPGDKARTPLAELDKYSTSLRSINTRQGNYTGKFAEYATVPGEIQKKLAEEYKKNEDH